MRRARTSKPSAPRCRATPWPNSRLRRSLTFPVCRATDEQCALECRRPAGAALLVRQGDARDVVLAPDPLRCAAVDARVGGCLPAAERVPLRASQDRCRDILRLWPQSRRLRTFRARALHEGVRLMRVGRRGEKRGRGARVMGHACDPRRISSLYGIACSSRGTHDGSSASYVRSICCVVHAVQNIVCAEPIGHLHFHHY